MNGKHTKVWRKRLDCLDGSCVVFFCSDCDSILILSSVIALTVAYQLVSLFDYHVAGDCIIVSL